MVSGGTSAYRVQTRGSFWVFAAQPATVGFLQKLPVDTCPLRSLCCCLTCRQTATARYHSSSWGPHAWSGWLGCVLWGFPCVLCGSSCIPLPTELMTFHAHNKATVISHLRAIQSALTQPSRPHTSDTKSLIPPCICALTALHANTMRQPTAHPTPHAPHTNPMPH